MIHKLIYDSVLQTTKQALKMGANEGLILFLKVFFYPLYGFVLFINIDNVKGWLLMGLAILSWAAHFDYNRKRRKQILREKEYDLLEREREKRKRDREEQRQQTN